MILQRILLFPPGTCPRRRPCTMLQQILQFARDTCPHRRPYTILQRFVLYHSRTCPHSRVPLPDSTDPRIKPSSNNSGIKATTRVKGPTSPRIVTSKEHSKHTGMRPTVLSIHSFINIPITLLFPHCMVPNPPRRPLHESP